MSEPLPAAFPLLPVALGLLLACSSAQGQSTLVLPTPQVPPIKGLPRPLQPITLVFPQTPAAAVAPASPVTAPAPAPAQLPVQAAVQPAQPPANPDLAAELESLHQAGRFAELGSRGLAALQNREFTPEPALRLKIANSLAWTHRLESAIPEYKTLASIPETAGTAQQALGNAYRWTGRPDLALPVFQTLAQNSPSPEASEGLELTQRELRPRTTLTVGRASDSGDLTVQSGTLTHRWRSPSLAQVFEVEAEMAHDRQLPAGPSVRHRGGTVRMENPTLPLEPQFHLSAQGKPSTGYFGGVRVRLGDWPVHFSLGRENFGLTSLSARALDAGLTSNTWALDARFAGSAGVLSGRWAHHRISDGNRLDTVGLKYTPEWRPLGPAFKPYVTIDTREVSFNTANYWSPAAGSGTLGLGAAAEWAEKDWVFFVAGQLGSRLYGDAGRGWSASLGGQRWLNRDWALTLNLWGMSSQRDGIRYRAHSTTVKLDRLW